MNPGHRYQTSPSTWFAANALVFPLFNFARVQVIVPLYQSAPPPYTSTAHLPTPYAHRIVSKFNMSLYASRFSDSHPYPSAPPGESTWPTFLQVRVHSGIFIC
jgi:hypothetical protein